MIDTYILYLENQLSKYHLENMFSVDLIWLVIIKKTKPKVKAMWHDFSSHDVLTRLSKF